MMMSLSGFKHKCLRKVSKRVMGLHNFAYNEFTKTILVKIVG
ncbi:Uncharacterised protein [Mycobacteroides abscessus subsp. abscessus]|nr:Uncharacterised protein [Mycobacteroides abscessus subsp. abscessus]